ncbi:hypothetical protein HYQ46_011498 [Verticillium longisporum]|nr:hypothetical protein HYQ46_011498 [Verticillium longisporum]
MSREGNVDKELQRLGVLVGPRDLERGVASGHGDIAEEHVQDILTKKRVDQAASARRLDISATFIDGVGELLEGIHDGRVAFEDLSQDIQSPIAPSTVVTTASSSSEEGRPKHLGSYAFIPLVARSNDETEASVAQELGSASRMKMVTSPAAMIGMIKAATYGSQFVLKMV